MLSKTLHQLCLPIYLLDCHCPSIYLSICLLVCLLIFVSLGLPDGINIINFPSFHEDHPTDFSCGSEREIKFLIHNDDND